MKLITLVFRNVLFIFVLYFSTSFAQVHNIRTFGAREGLIQSQVYSILQEDNGYMWFGTVNGVSRFDGRTFKNFTKMDGLGSNYISCGLKDLDGNLWYGHANGTASKFNVLTRTFETIYLMPQYKGRKSVFVMNLFEDKQGRIWIATSEWGVFYFENDSLYQISKKEGLNDIYVYDIEQDDQGNIWISTYEGINIFNPETKTLDSLKTDFGYEHNVFSALLNDKQGNMWLGTTAKGLAKYNFKTQKIEKYTEEDGLAGSYVSSLYLAPDETIWVNYEEGGVSFHNQKIIKKSKTDFIKITKKNGLPYNGVLVSYQDPEGNMWFGTPGRGVAQLRDRRFEVWTDRQGLLGNSVWDIYIDKKGNKWFGTNMGLTQIRKMNGEITQFSHFKETDFFQVSNICEDNYGKIWFTSYDTGLMCLNPNTGYLKEVNLPDKYINFYISSFLCDEDDLWISSLYDGLFKYNLKSNKFTHYTSTDNFIPSDSLSYIFKDQSGNMWIGMTNQGLARFDGERFEKIGKYNHTITTITEGAQNDFWFLDDQDHLLRYQNGRFTDYSIGYGLEGNVLYSVVADSQNVWVGTSVGVARMGLKETDFTFFGLQQGFPIAESNQNAVFRDETGQIWFGTIEGAVRYFPDRERINDKAPFTFIRGLKIFFKESDFPKEGLFKYKQNHLTFDFIGISLSVPERVKYRYRLEGFDNGWSPATKVPSVTYSNLAPGEYTLKVIAGNNDGVWNKVPATYSFTIETPFWLTRWFFVLIILLVAIIIYSFLYWRTRAVKRLNYILGRKVDERTQELQREKESVEIALAALQESETKFGTYTDLTSSGIFIHQNDRFQYVNQATQNISGYDKDELIETNIWRLAHPDDRDRIKELILSGVAGKELVEHYEIKLITKVGNICWVDFSGLLIDHLGSPALLGTMVDITQRKQAEEELMAEKERLAVTLRSIGDGVITTDTRGRITLANRQAEQILGLEENSLIDKTLDDRVRLFDENTGERIVNPVQQVVVTHGSEINELNCILKTADNTQKFISFASSPLRNSFSELIGVVIVLRDVSEKRMMEQELFKSQKLESVGVLAGGIAHDFNNILTAIIGNLSLAKLTIPVEDKSYDRIEKAEKASARAQELTQQLLTFSKGGAPVKQVTSIAEIIRDSVGFVLSGSNVRCKLELDSKMPALEVDPGQISQVIQNLVINADQAMPDGGELKIMSQVINLKRGRKGLVPGRYVQIDVSDEGIGIPQHYLDKIFDPFFTTKQSGSGLGLATSYSIIQKHNGLLTVTSHQNVGTVFSVYLPITTNVKMQNTDADEDVFEFRSGGRVLVMDDETFIHETATNMLNTIGFEVAVAFDGQETLDIYQEAMLQDNPFSAVIMDLTIPGGMGGKTAIKKLLKIDPNAQVIVSSGYSSDPVMAQYHNYGFKACLKKPYRLNELISSFRELEANSQENESSSKLDPAAASTAN